MSFSLAVSISVGIAVGVTLAIVILLLVLVFCARRNPHVVKRIRNNFHSMPSMPSVARFR